MRTFTLDDVTSVADAVIQAAGGVPAAPISGSSTRGWPSMPELLSEDDTAPLIEIAEREVNSRLRDFLLTGFPAEDYEEHSGGQNPSVIGVLDSLAALDFSPQETFSFACRQEVIWGYALRKRHGNVTQARLSLEH